MAEDRLINEEYRIWKKNSPFLYDVVMTHALEWPSLTVEWLPDFRKVSDGKYSEQRLILGTHTADGEPNHLIIATVRLPLEDEEADAGKMEDDDAELGGFGGHCGKIEIYVQIPHEGEVNRARFMPQNSFIIATKSPNSQVLIFDYSKHSTPKDATCRPELRLAGHTMEGGGDDNMVCIWDVALGSSAKGGVLQPLQTLTSHTAVVEDVAWHCHHSECFGSVGDDRRLLLWDMRDSSGKPRGDYAAHEDGINCLAFNPFQEFLLATGSSDCTVALWDMRNMKTKVHSFVNHEGEVFQTQWSPFNESILASSGSDRRVDVWDMTKIGMQQSAEDAEDGPPELLFVHGGHCAKISDMAWSSNEDWMVASVAEDNVLQIWQMAEHIYDDDAGEAAPADADLE